MKKAALDLKRYLGDLGLVTFAMLTGGKGVHVIAPLTPEAEWSAVKDFAHRFALALEERVELFQAADVSESLQVQLSPCTREVRRLRKHLHQLARPVALRRGGGEAHAAIPHRRCHRDAG